MSPVTYVSKPRNWFKIAGGYFYLALAGVMLALWVRGIWGHDLWLTSLVMLGIWVAFLVHFFLLAGFEVAYTDLRDKDPLQLNVALRPFFCRCKQENPEYTKQRNGW